MRYLIVLGLAVTLLTPTPAAAAGNPCDLIVHRGMNGTTLTEETVPSVTKSAPFGFGAEIDARVAKDGIVAVHDDRLSRISGYTDKRQPEAMTMRQLRQVHLVNGGVLASIAQLVKATKHAHGRLIIEGKRYPEHQQAWDHYGLDLLAKAIRHFHMTRRVWVGGTLGFTRAFHDHAPKIQTFWRADVGEALTTDNAGIHWATLVEAGAGRWTRHTAHVYRVAGIIPATRNADNTTDWQAAWNAGVTTWQTNRPAAARAWCAAKGGTP